MSKSSGLLRAKCSKEQTARTGYLKTNWNDYWFQGDKLIRDFDTMYKDIEEPWLQRERAFQPRLFVGLSLLQWMLRDNPSRKLEILDEIGRASCRERV